MPTDEQRALWAAIRTDPLDDTPRLVYADWLQEHGDEARAEFIRLQCQIARLPADRKTQRKVLPALEHRERVLLTANRARWAEPVFRALMHSRRALANLDVWARATSYRRGFISGLRLDLDGLHRIATAGGELEPLDNVVAQFFGSGTYNPRKFAEAFAWEWIGCVSHLGFYNATDNCVGAIVASSAARLTHLALPTGEITDSGAIFLAGWACAARLESLHLSANRVGDRGAVALAESPHLERITQLNLEHNPLGHLARRRLIARFGGNVTLSPET